MRNLVIQTKLRSFATAGSGVLAFAHEALFRTAQHVRRQSRDRSPREGARCRTGHGAVRDEDALPAQASGGTAHQSEAPGAEADRRGSGALRFDADLRIFRKREARTAAVAARAHGACPRPLALARVRRDLL